MSEAVEEHHRIMRKALRQSSGYEVKTVGDSFMVAFKNVDDAVQFSLDAQRYLYEAEWNSEIDATYVELLLEAEAPVGVLDPRSESGNETVPSSYVRRNKGAASLFTSDTNNATLTQNSTIRNTAVDGDDGVYPPTPSTTTRALSDVSSYAPFAPSFITVQMQQTKATVSCLPLTHHLYETDVAPTTNNPALPGRTTSSHGGSVSPSTFAAMTVHTMNTNISNTVANSTTNTHHTNTNLDAMKARLTTVPDDKPLLGEASNTSSTVAARQIIDASRAAHELVEDGLVDVDEDSSLQSRSSPSHVCIVSGISNTEAAGGACHGGKSLLTFASSITANHSQYTIMPTIDGFADSNNYNYNRPNVLPSSFAENMQSTCNNSQKHKGYHQGQNKFLALHANPSASHQLVSAVVENLTSKNTAIFCDPGEAIDRDASVEQESVRITARDYSHVNQKHGPSARNEINMGNSHKHKTADSTECGHQGNRKIWHGLRVRIGVHYGMGDIRKDPVSLGYDYYGTVVNTAARVEGVGHGGQILVTEGAFSALSEGFISSSKAVVVCFGPQPLRGLDEAIKLYQLVPESLRGRRFPPLRLHIEKETEDDDALTATAENTTASGTAMSEDPEAMITRLCSSKQFSSAITADDLHDRYAFFTQTFAPTSSKYQLSVVAKLAEAWGFDKKEVARSSSADASEAEKARIKINFLAKVTKAYNVANKMILGRAPQSQQKSAAKTTNSCALKQNLAHEERSSCHKKTL